MSWDFGRAMQRKQEYETERLLDFEFRLRARTTRRVADRLDLDPVPLLGRIVEQDHAAFLDRLSRETGLRPEQVADLWLRAESEARAELVAERGDPTPYRLA